MKISRREFFVKGVQGIAIAAVPAVLSTYLASCKDNSTSPGPSSSMSTIQGTESGGIVSVTINSSSPLAQIGTAAIVTYPSGSIMVDRPSENIFNALNRTCTHAGCTISSFDTGSKQFICTCHSSRFDQAGQVVQGPASTALPKYITQFANNILTIKIT